MSIDDDALLEGLQIGDDLLIKATLRIPMRPMRHAVTQTLSDDLNALYRARMSALEADVMAVLEEDGIEKSAAGSFVVTSDGRLLFKAEPKLPKMSNSPIGGRYGGNPSEQAATGKHKMSSSAPVERKLTPSGYVHVERAGSRGGKFWRDDKGNVRYGERPHGSFTKQATPDNVVEHFRQYYMPQPFAAHDQLDLHDALLHSDALSEADHNFMEWWHDNYDNVLSSFGITRNDVEKAGGLHNISVKIGGRNIGFEEATEEFFRTNADLFVGDPQYGDVESPEDILEVIRGLMGRYRKALHEDPKVQAAATASAEKLEIHRNAFYIKAEQMADEFSPLASDMMLGDDPNDLAVRMTVAMHQMGLIKRGSKGGVAQRRMRGAIIPESGLLLTRKRDLGSLWKDNQLERLNASQLMAVYTATDAQNSFSSDNTYDYAPGDHTDATIDGVFDLIAQKLGIVSNDSAARSTLKRKLQKTSEATLKAFTDYNTGQDPHFADVFKMKMNDVAGKSDIMDDHLVNVAKEQARIVKILAAQEDDSFDVPLTMKDGIWNGKTLKDPNDPSKGVWEPFGYQKKYINWMMAVKRGVIAQDAGMGKSPTVIAFMEQLRAQGKDIPAVMFLPPSLMEQWPGVIAKFAPESADKILNLSGFSLEERKVALQSDLAKKARYIFISSGTLTGDVPDPNASEDENDGTGGSDHEMVKILQNLEGAVFIDEAHSGGYKKAGNTRHEIAKAVMQDREYAFGMTATPMPNDPMDLYHLANLFAPDSVGDQELWSGRMAGVAWNEDDQAYRVSNPEHLADLNKRLKPFVFYKSITDPDVVADMGKGLTKRVGVSESKEQWPDEGDLALSKVVSSENGLSQNDYFKEDGVIDTMVKLRIERLIKERRAKIEAREINPSTGERYEEHNEGALALMAGGMQMMLQRQASISPALIDASYRKSDGGIAHTPKLKAFCDDVIAHFSNSGQGGKAAKGIVAFCSFPQKAFPIIRKALAERGIDPSLIDTIAGDVAPSERGYIQDKYNKGHSKVLLTGTVSGGAGLNLQEGGNKTLFIDEPWNPAQKRQAIGRQWRTGQTEDVHEKTYRSVGTYDMMVEQKIAGKQAMVGALLGKELPTSATFDVEGSVHDLMRRVQGATFSEAQIKTIMENAKSYDLASPGQKEAEETVGSVGLSKHAKKIEALGEDWKESAAAGGRGGLSAQLTDKDFEPSKEGKANLKKRGAHALTKNFDEKEFRGQWELDRNKRNSKQKFQMANLMEQVYRDKGDNDKADHYAKQAEGLQKEYPELASEKPKTGSKKEAKGKVKAVAEQPKAAEKPKQATATVGTAERTVEKKTAQKQQKDSEDWNASPIPKGSEPSKVTSKKPNLGLEFHSSDNPFKEGSTRKVKGSEISQGEAHHFFERLTKTRSGDWNEFIKKELKPIWDDEDGRNPFSNDKAEEYMQKVVGALQSQGLMTQSMVAFGEKKKEGKS